MDEPGVVSRRTHGCLTLALVFLFSVLATVVSVFLVKVWGLPIPPGAAGGFTILYIILANLAADRILKRLGLSRSGTVVEVWTRPRWVPDDEMPLGEFAEARIPPGTSLLIATGMLMAAVLFLCAPLMIESGVFRWLGFGMGVFFLGALAYGLWHGDKPQAKVDAKGVFGFPSHRAIRQILVPWSDVLTCEIRTIYDTFGKPVLLIPTLKGHNGETLMHLNLQYTPIAEQERIAKFIKSRLSDKEVDPWEI